MPKLNAGTNHSRPTVFRPGIPLCLQDARRLVAGYVDHYNSIRLPTAIGHITPCDKLLGKEKAIFAERDFNFGKRFERESLKV